jgi:alpha-L-fucosidase
MFMHFNLATFANIEHNCYQGPCLSPSLFNPSNLNATQWVITAREMGAGEICLTAHHEGGFCLWPTKYSNYSVKASPWKNGQGDVIKEFTEACHENGIRPCFYLSASADGYHRSLSVEEYIHDELGMLTEVLTQYGPIYRLWFDHYGSPCGGGLTGCPGGFPAYWYNVTEHVRAVSPETLMGPGADVWYNGGGESGSGMYPLWNPSDTVDGTPWNSTTVSGPQGRYFRPRESDMTIQNPGDKWFWGKGHAYYNASQLWEHWMVTVGRGANFILNIPPDTTGVIPSYFTAETKKFGDALQATFSTPLASMYDIVCNCNETVSVQFSESLTFDIIITMENMINGQRIISYELDALVNNSWIKLTVPNGQTVGHKVVDLLPDQITATEIRFRCQQSVVDPIYIRQIAVYKQVPPS